MDFLVERFFSFSSGKKTLYVLLYSPFYPPFYDCQFGAFLPEKVLFLRIEGYIIEQKKTSPKGQGFHRNQINEMRD